MYHRDTADIQVAHPESVSDANHEMELCGHLLRRVPFGAFTMIALISLIVKRNPTEREVNY